MTVRDKSAAYYALSPAGRKVLAVIEDEIARTGSGAAAISHRDFERLSGLLRGTTGFALKQLSLLGFVSIRRGPPPKHPNIFRLADGWQNLDVDEAKRRRLQAFMICGRKRMDRAQMFTSPAYAALSLAGRAVLTTVEREIERGGGVAVITFNELVRRCDLSRSACANGLKQVELLGFVSIDMGPRPQFIRTLRLIDKWQRIDADEAQRLQLKSRLPKEQPAPQPVAPRAERRQPSLPVLHFADDP